MTRVNEGLVFAGAALVALGLVPMFLGLGVAHGGFMGILAIPLVGSGLLVAGSALAFGSYRRPYRILGGILIGVGSALLALIVWVLYGPTMFL